MLKGLIFTFVAGIVLVAVTLLGMAMLVALIRGSWRVITAPFDRRGRRT